MSLVQKKVAQEAPQLEELNDADLMAVVGGSGGLLSGLTDTVKKSIDGQKLDDAFHLGKLDGALNGGDNEKVVDNVLNTVGHLV